MEGARAGDQAAFRHLVERYQDSIYGLALRMVRRPEIAVEVAQDAFVRAYRGLPRFEARSRFSTWLYRITVNLCYDRLARRAAPVMLEMDALAAGGHEPAAGASWGAGAAIDEAESRRAFEEALEALSDNYRVPFVLRQIEGRAYGEIAGVLGITETNAKVRVHRAREMMVAWLKERGAL